MPMFCPGDFPSPVFGNSECDACGGLMKDHDNYEGFVDGEDYAYEYGYN